MSKAFKTNTYSAASETKVTSSNIVGPKLYIPIPKVSENQMPFSTKYINEAIHMMERGTYDRPVELKFPTTIGYKFTAENVKSKENKETLQTLVASVLTEESNATITLPLGYIFISIPLGTENVNVNHFHYEARTNTIGALNFLNQSGVRPSLIVTKKSEESWNYNLNSVEGGFTSNGAFLLSYSTVCSKNPEPKNKNMMALAQSLLKKRDAEGVDINKYMESKIMKELLFMIEIPSVEINTKSTMPNTQQRVELVYDTISSHINMLSKQRLVILAKAETLAYSTFFYKLVSANNNVIIPDSVSTTQINIRFAIEKTSFWSNFKNRNVDKSNALSELFRTYGQKFDANEIEQDDEKEEEEEEAPRHRVAGRRK